MRRILVSLVLLALVLPWHREAAAQEAPERPFTILVTNDDGYNAPGIRALVDSLVSIAAVVVAAPEGVATFRQLAARARMIAGCVRDEGGDPERPVLLFFEPGIQLVAAMLGVLEAGRFFVCLDPAARSR